MKKSMMGKLAIGALAAGLLISAVGEADARVRRGTAALLVAGVVAVGLLGAAAHRPTSRAASRRFVASIARSGCAMNTVISYRVNRRVCYR